MRTATAADIDGHLDAYLDELRDEPLVITWQGRPVAALVRVDDDEGLERLLLGHTRELRQLLEAAYGRIRRDGGLSEEEFWKAVEAQTERISGATPDRSDR